MSILMPYIVENSSNFNTSRHRTEIIICNNLNLIFKSIQNFSLFFVALCTTNIIYI